MDFPFRLPMLCNGITDCSRLIKNSDDDLYGEQEMMKQPQLLGSAIQTSISSGADAVFAPTGGISRSKLEEMGIDDDFSAYNEWIVEKTKQYADTDTLIGGVDIPSRLFKPPYTKNFFEDAYFDYLEKFTILKDAGVDFILLKDQNSLLDMRSGVLAAKSLDLPVFVVMNVDEDGKNANETDYLAALITLQAIGADAFGIYCTDGIKAESALIENAFPHADIPLIAVLNSDDNDIIQLTALSKSGASVFIDTASWSDKTKTSLFKNTTSHFDPKSEKDNYAAAIDCEAFFLPDNLVLSEPMDCTYDMSDDIIDLDDENINAVYIPLDSTDDVTMLTENAAMSRLPFIVNANDMVTLEAALRYFQGRLIIDTRCDIDPEKLHELAKKYGAILY